MDDHQTENQLDTLQLDVSCTSTLTCVSRDPSCMDRTMSTTTRIALSSSQGFGRIVRHQIIVQRFIPLTQHSVLSPFPSLLVTTNLSEAVILTTQRACGYYRARCHASWSLGSKSESYFPQYILDFPRVHPLKSTAHTALCAFYTPLKFPKPSLESLKSPSRK